MRNLVVLLSTVTVGLLLIAVVVRLVDGHGDGHVDGRSAATAPPDEVGWIRRGWAAIVHPKRRGLPDPTWPQVWIALTAFGAFLIALATATAPTRLEHLRGAAISTTGSPYAAIWIPGVVVALLGTVGIVGCAVVAFLRRRDDRVTPFELIHTDTDGECNEIFHVGVGRDWFGQQIRVGVRNISSQGVQRVRVFMRMEGSVGRSYYLHLQHDNDPARQASRNGENLTTGQTSYFDLAIIKEFAAIQGVKYFWFYYADESIQELSRLQLFGPTEWTFRLEVSGWTDFRDVVSLPKNYRLRIDHSYVMTLEEIVAP